MLSPLHVYISRRSFNWKLSRNGDKIINGLKLDNKADEQVWGWGSKRPSLITLTEPLLMTTGLRDQLWQVQSWVEASAPRGCLPGFQWFCFRSLSSHFLFRAISSINVFLGKGRKASRWYGKSHKSVDSFDIARASREICAIFTIFLLWFLLLQLEVSNIEAKCSAWLQFVNFGSCF